MENQLERYMARTRQTQRRQRTSPLKNDSDNGAPQTRRGTLMAGNLNEEAETKSSPVQDMRTYKLERERKFTKYLEEEWAPDDGNKQERSLGTLKVMLERIDGQIEELRRQEGYVCDVKDMRRYAYL